MLIWLNGEIKENNEAQLNASAAGVTLGWGVFTTIGIWHSRVFALERHLARLQRDANATDIPIHFNNEQISAALSEVITRNSIEAGYARLTVTRRADGRWNQQEGGDFSIFAMPRAASHPQSLRLALSPYRLEARRPLAGIKSTSYLDHQLAWREVTTRGYDETILCNSQGALCECARANVFWVSDGELRTPSLESGCLPGIAREMILEWCAAMGIDFRQGLFTPHELVVADEVFITAATTGPRPAKVYYDGVTVNGIEEIAGIEHQYAAPGPITQLLQKQWDQAIQVELA